jgi:hypothetical protein
MWWLFWLNDPIWHRYTTFETREEPKTIAQVFDIICPKQNIILENEAEDDVSDYKQYYWHFPDKNEDINI